MSEGFDRDRHGGRVAVIVGVGPGLGASLARRFAREGYALALMARSSGSLAPVEAELVRLGARVHSIAVDAADPASVTAAFQTVRIQLGDPEVLIYNAGAFQIGGLLEISVGTFENGWRVNCFGAFLAAREVLPSMAKSRRGTILLTGATASRRGSARFASLAVGKFGLRALAESMAREFGPQGVHVAHVVIDGQIVSERALAMIPGRDPSTLLLPDAIAETYWHLHSQERSSWTLELDLRPSVEKF